MRDIALLSPLEIDIAQIDKEPFPVVLNALFKWQKNVLDLIVQFRELETSHVHRVGIAVVIDLFIAVALGLFVADLVLPK